MTLNLISNDPQTFPWKVEQSRSNVEQGVEHRRKIVTQVLLYVQKIGSDPAIHDINVEIKDQIKILKNGDSSIIRSTFDFRKNTPTSPTRKQQSRPNKSFHVGGPDDSRTT